MLPATEGSGVAFKGPSPGKGGADRQSPVLQTPDVAEN